MGEFVNVINSVGDAGALSKLLVPGKEIRVQITYNNNYVVMDRNLIVENGEEVEYLTLNLSEKDADGTQKWYKSQTDAINAFLGTTSVPTPEALKTVTVKKNSVISVTRTGSTDNYDVTPKIVNTFALVVNGEPVAWTTVNTAANTSATKSMATKVGLCKTAANSATPVTFTKTGYETLVLTDKYTGKSGNDVINCIQLSA